MNESTLSSKPVFGITEQNNSPPCQQLGLGVGGTCLSLPTAAVQPRDATQEASVPSLQDDFKNRNYLIATLINVSSGSVIS